MRKLSVVLTVLMLSTALLTACSKGQDTLAPKERETQARWGLTIEESSTETESGAESETAAETEVTASVITLDNGVKLMEQKDTELQTVSAVNVRSGPGTDFDKLGQFAGGEKAAMTGICDNGWVRIDYEGEVGYVSMDFVESADGSISLPALLEQVKIAGETADNESSAEESQETGSTEESGESVEETGSGDVSEEGKLAWATTDVNVRKGPKASYETIGQLNQGQSVKVLDSSDAWWWKVEFEGQEAYICVPYLTTEKPE